MRGYLPDDRDLTCSVLIGLVATILLTESEVEKPRWEWTRALEGTTLDTDFLNIDGIVVDNDNFHGKVEASIELGNSVSRACSRHTTE